MENLKEKTQESKKFIEGQIDTKPQIGLILGSGLGVLANEIQNPIKIPYEDIPNFPVSTVEGHASQLVIGKLEGKEVIAMQGRFHYYEGYSMKEVTFPVRVMKALGVEMLVITNACGGMNPELYPGALTFITDHINWTHDNPLIGPNDDKLGVRFPDMSTAYDPELITLGESIAKAKGITTERGIYAGITGPTYQTKAEMKMLRLLGADTVGMSTVPEVIVAKHAGLKVLGISCITDMAIAEEMESISHEEVLAVAEKTRPKFIDLVKGIVSEVNIL